MAGTSEQKIVIVGAGGRLGAALAREWREEFGVTGFTRAQLDLAEPNELRATLGKLDFDVLINAAALTNVDYCEEHRAEAMRINAEAPHALAEICREKDARFLHVSTDYVFDGEKREPYREEDTAEPISVYGESKREGERLVLDANERALVLRVSWVFGPDRPSFVDAILQKARAEEEVSAVADKFSTPTYTKDIAELLPPLLKDSSVSGLLHMAGRGACSWQQYAQWALDCCHRLNIPMRATKVGASSLGEMKSFVARRPIYTVLATEKYEQLTGAAPRDWHDAVADYVRDYFPRA
ncbi:MAG: dTDP-4-dehydrorhamnose reductase [Chthoniobacterales bacterium]|nr:dTDP-4-dehydrorhamnose reductase [Chthoniobacterales bacterium]